MAKIKVKLVKSKIGSTKRQIGTLRALGLNKTNSTAEHEATPQILGMVAKVNHLVSVEEVN
ncbi:MAG: 50S ribosomal protein L30 [Odoribacter sp.]|nr:50S ribosomal protein L30 [Odoribacter sp.]